MRRCEALASGWWAEWQDDRERALHLPGRPDNLQRRLREMHPSEWALANEAELRRSVQQFIRGPRRADDAIFEPELSGASGKWDATSLSWSVNGAPVRAGEVAMTLRVRALGEEEAHRLARMTRSQKLGAGLVRRAQIIQHAVDGLSAPGIAAKMGLCGATVRFWLKRFNERGLPGLEEDMRSGRPPTYTAEERSAVIAAALSRPADLGLPFASWTLDRLVAYLGEKGIGMKRSRVSEVLLAEGLKWRQEETWFGARVDPEFERKRGRSSASTPPRPRAA